MAAGQEGDLEVEFRKRIFVQIDSQKIPEGTATVTDEKKEKPIPKFNIHSVFWIVAAVSVTYYIGFFDVVHEVLQQGCMWMLTGIMLLMICLSVALYCIIYLEGQCGISDYDKQYPALVFITVSVFTAAAVCCNIALWSVWSVLTPVILFTQFMGVVMLISLF
ncbi:hypothetical protein GDO86_000214 [Hymenochirus boettgeri]|uniref:Transmembrane protein 128 n=1 Tax=Hymenochirus boettgeri TaxID=247094 RepID=A0A8T2KFU7_9PIPI|nr:hypothetical protein GDO86_000214 [Hymenochirus boettgeri]